MLFVRFNSGRRYSKEGQRIVAVQLDDGTIHFNDIDRMVDGFLTERSCLYGADPGPPKVFRVLDVRGIVDEVTRRYVTGDLYRSSSSVGRDLKWEEKGS